MDRRLVRVGHEALVHLHHGEQVAVFAEPLHFPLFAQLRGTLADAVGGVHFRWHDKAAVDAFLFHHLGFAVGEFEAGLVHQAAEAVEAGLGLLVLAQLLFVLVEDGPAAADPLAFGAQASLGLAGLPAHVAHRGFEVRHQTLADGVRQLVEAENRFALALEVFVGSVRIVLAGLADTLERFVHDGRGFSIGLPLGGLGLGHEGFTATGGWCRWSGSACGRLGFLWQLQEGDLPASHFVVGHLLLQLILGHLAGTQFGDDLEARLGFVQIRVDVRGCGKELLGVVEAIHGDGVQGQFHELVAVQAELFAGHGQGAVGRQHHRCVLACGPAPLLLHGRQEVVVGVGSGHCFAEFDRRGLAGHGAVNRYGQLLGFALERTHHQHRAVGPQRRQLAGQEFRFGRGECHFGGLDDRHIEGVGQAFCELEAAGGGVDVFLHPYHGATREHAEAVQRVGGNRDAQWHAEELHVLLDQLLAHVHADGFAQRCACGALAVAQVQDHLLAAGLVLERLQCVVEARLHVHGPGSVLVVHQGLGGFLHRFVVGALESAGEAAGVLLVVEVDGPDVEAVVRPEFVAEGREDLRRLVERLPGLAGGGIHHHQDVLGPGLGGELRLQLPGERGLAAFCGVGQRRHVAVLRLGQLVDQFRGGDSCNRLRWGSGRSQIAEHQGTERHAGGSGTDDRCQHPETFQGRHTGRSSQKNGSDPRGQGEVKGTRV